MRNISTDFLCSLIKCLAFPLAGLVTKFEPSGWDLGLREQGVGRESGLGRGQIFN